MTRTELRNKAHVSKQAVSKAIKDERIQVDNNGDIPDYHEDTIKFIQDGIERYNAKINPSIKVKLINGSNPKNDFDSSPDNDSQPKRRDLELKKINADIALKHKQGRKLDLQFEIDKQGLIPSELVAIWIGYFASGIRTNFLNIGNRVARGNTKLRDNIEREISKAIEKTLSNAEDRLKKESNAIIKSMEELK